MSGGGGNGALGWGLVAAVAGGLYALLKSSASQEIGWVKLNVDGSRVHEGPSLPPSAGCGGVFRDESGTWMHGFAQKLEPSCDVHETELQAILTGLQLARDWHIKKLMVESDSDSVVYLVKNGCRVSHPQFNVITRIKELLSCDQWEVRLNSIHRNANRVANRLANDARNLSFGLHLFPSPPVNCCRLLVEDAQGLCI